MFRRVSMRLGHASVVLIADTYTSVLPATHHRAAEATARLILTTARGARAKVNAKNKRKAPSWPAKAPATVSPPWPGRRRRWPVCYPTSTRPSGPARPDDEVLLLKPQSTFTATPAGITCSPARKSPRSPSARCCAVAAEARFSPGWRSTVRANNSNTTLLWI